MIFGREKGMQARSLQDIDPGNLATMKAAFEQTFEDNVTQKFIQRLDLYEAESQGIHLPAEEVKKRAEMDKVQIGDIPKEGMSEGAYELISKRQKEINRRNEIMASSDTNMFFTGAASLAAGLLDPANLAADFVFSAGLGAAFRTAKFIKAGRGINRLARRGAIGAAEGGLGAAALEPASYALSQDLGDDYTMVDSLQNIAFGTVLGGGLHMGAGSLSDAFRNVKAKRLKAKRSTRDANIRTGETLRADPEITLDQVLYEATPQGAIPERLAKSSPETRRAYFKTAVAQLAEDRPVNLAAIEAGEVLDSFTKLENVNTKLNKAIQSNDEVSIRRLTKDKQALEDIINDSAPGMIEQRPAGRGLGEVEPTIIAKDSMPANLLDNKGRLKPQETIDYIKKSVRNNLDTGDSVKLNIDGQTKEITGIEGNKLIDTDGNGYDIDSIIDGKADVALNSPDYHTDPVDSMATRIMKDKQMPTLDSIKQKALSTSDMPNSNFIDDSLNTQYDKFTDDLKGMEDMSIIDQTYKNDLDDVRVLAEQEGIDISKEIEGFDALTRDAAESADFIDRMARCVTSRGI